MVFPRRIRCFALLLAILPLPSCLPTDEIAWLGFSRDGRYLGCATQKGLLTIVNLVTREKTDVTDHAALGGFEWSPTHNRLVFCLKREKVWDLALLDVAGTVSLITRDRWRDFQPTWAPDGHGVYFVSSRGGGFRGDYDIRYVELESGQSYPVISGPHDQIDPRVSPDGRWLAAVSFREGNPIVLVYGIKSMRVIQIPLPPDYRGYRLSLRQWTSDSRRLLAEIQSRNRYHLVECDVDSEEWRSLESSAQPFDSVCTIASAPELIYVTGGKAYRRRPDSLWGARRALSLGDLPVTRLARCPSDGRFGVVVSRSLLGVAPRSGRKVEPILGIPEESLAWGDVEIQQGRWRAGLRRYEGAFEAYYARHGEGGDEAVARAKLSRATLLCRYGHTRRALAWLQDANRVLRSLDEASRDKLYGVSALAQFVGNGNEAAARSWAERVAEGRRSNVLSGKVALLLKILDHPDGELHRVCRHLIADLWRRETRKGFDRLEGLLESHPGDPVVDALCRQALRDRFALPQEGVFELEEPDDQSRRATARAAVRFLEIAGDELATDREWFQYLAEAYLARGDADGLGRLAVKYGRKFMDRKAALDAYRQYWQPGPKAAAADPVAEETLAMVLFDPAILDLVYSVLKDPVDWTDVNLARVRRALVGGDYADAKMVLGAMASQVEKRGPRQMFGNGPDREAAYMILQAALAEREGAWVRAVQRYREASRIIAETLEKTVKDNAETTRLERLQEETQFRAELFQRGASARGEIVELLTVERGVGDALMTYSKDPTSLANGIHNFFGMLSRVGTPWVVDLIYLKAGQGYRLLDRWGEAAFCLRVAARSEERFVAQRANAELERLYRELGDEGLAEWYERRR